MKPGVEEYTYREYTWSKVDKKVKIFRPGKKIKRTNIVAAIYENKVIAPFSYSWSTISTWFDVWFEWNFCPALLKNSVIVM